MHYTTPENRTYSLVTKGSYSTNVHEDEMKLFGWNSTEENPQVKAVVSLYGYKVGSAQKNSQKKETKDDDGNVTKSWTEYSYTNNATGLATLYVYCLLYTSPSPRDATLSRMPSSA